MTPEAKRLKDRVHALSLGDTRGQHGPCGGSERDALGRVTYYATDATWEHLAKVMKDGTP